MPVDPRVYGARGRFQVRSYQGRFVSNGSGIEWKGLEFVDAAYQRLGEQLKGIAAQTAEALAPVMEDYMKTNASWDDRTTDARKGLKTVVVHGESGSIIYAGYDTSTPYGFFLENYTYSGVNYAIVRPTIEYFSQVMSGYLVSGRLGL